MLEEMGLVTRKYGDFVEVEAQRASTCGSCEAKSSCGTTLLASMLGNRKPVIRVANNIQAEVGDQVIIGLQGGALTRLSMAAYLVPLLCLIGGAIAGETIAEMLGTDLSESAAIFGGLSGIWVGLMWLRRYIGKIEQDVRFNAVLLRKAKEPSVKVKVTFG